MPCFDALCLVFSWLILSLRGFRMNAGVNGDQRLVQAGENRDDASAELVQVEELTKNADKRMRANQHNTVFLGGNRPRRAERLVVQNSEHFAEVGSRVAQINDPVKGYMRLLQNLSNLYRDLLARFQVEKALVGYDEDRCIVKFSESSTHDAHGLVNLADQDVHIVMCFGGRRPFTCVNILLLTHPPFVGNDSEHIGDDSKMAF